MIRRQANRGRRAATPPPTPPHPSVAPRPAMLSRTLIAAATLCLTAGCHLVSSPRGTVPASRLPSNLFDCPRESLALLPLAALGQSKPLDHPIAAGDTLSIYIYGIFPASEEETPVIQQTQTLAQRYYPPRGTVVGPSTGLPIRVDQNGTVNLPLVDPVRIAGLTTSQAVERISAAYRAEELIKPDAERITVSLLVPRVHRIVVMREDTPNESVALVSPQAVDEIHRGSGETIDLPTYENDVLHALAETGGLPGTDAAREVYVIRSDPNLDYRYMSAGHLQSVVSGGRAGDCNLNVIRIPLVGCPCDALPFEPQDVVLGEGDVVFVPRRNEYFITGGLLPGGRVPLPRDQDVDVIEAIAMATGSPGGPLGLSGQVLAGGNPGYVREPTQVKILRRLPSGRQLAIRVDLDRAVIDPKERIRILPDDVVLLHHKPAAAVLNGTLNWISGNTLVALFD